MFRNCLAAALRHLAKSRLYAAINVLGLAAGFAVALVIALFARHELTYDRFLPDHENILRISAAFTPPGATPLVIDPTSPEVARYLREKHPELGTVVRLSGGDRHGVSAGNVEVVMSINWADPEFFDVFRFPAIAGDPAATLRTPDTVVITRAAARRLFSRDDVVGESITLDRQHAMRVSAVIEDLPPNTHLAFEMVASSRSMLSPYAGFDSTPINLSKPWGSYTYWHRKPGVNVASLKAALDELLDSSPVPEGATPSRQTVTFSILPIADIHLSPFGNAPMNRRGSVSLVYGLGLTAALILLIAGINFVNIATARAMRRATEVGVRKAAGATRGHLIVQFMGESLLYAGIGAVLALALAEWLLPLFNKLSFSNVRMDYAAAIACVAALALLIGLLAGAYPALVLASFRPALVLKGARERQRSGLLRQGLVMLQFAMLILLVTCIVVIFRQTRFAMEMAALIDTDRVIAIEGACERPSFVEAVRSLPGVESAACSQAAPFNWVIAQSFGEVRPGMRVSFARSPVDFGFFELYGLKPVAGRLFAREHGTDLFDAPQRAPNVAPATVLINQSAVKRFGFASAQEAVGEFLNLNGRERTSQIVGVVPDFPITTIREPIDAVIYVAQPSGFNLLSIKLRAGQESATLDGIDAAWRKHGKPLPSGRFSVTETRRMVYVGLVSQGQVFGLAAAIAGTLACLGMFGLAAFMAERRTREVGIRKAMGAAPTDIVRLLLWHLSRPVLLANLIAWPLAFFVMRAWLRSFPYRIELEPWMFLAASAAALLIAWLTVLAQAWRVSRAAPVAALRYE
jgi:putative ABC transport system permease protein